MVVVIRLPNQDAGVVAKVSLHLGKKKKEIGDQWPMPSAPDAAAPAPLLTGNGES
jgi:hypothetical protein